MKTTLIWCGMFCCICCSTAEIPPEYPLDGKNTSYACENSYLHIKCRGEGERILILFANYGRFSLTVCKGNQDHKGWNVQCSSNLSLLVVEQKCGGQKECTFLANSILFGEPCRDTKKYMKVEYTCVKAADTDNSTDPSPVIFGSSSTVPELITPLAPIIKAQPDDQEVQKYCEPTLEGNISWPLTMAGDIAGSQCNKGEATWLCGKNGKWVGIPDLRFCHHMSPWMKEIQDMLTSDTPVEKAIDKLNNNLKSMTLGSEDLKIATTSVLPGLISMMKKQINSEMTTEERREKVQNFNKEIVKSGSQLLDDSQQDSWKDLNLEERSKSATSLIISFEKMAVVVASTMGTSDIISMSEQNLVMEVSIFRMNKTRSPDLKLPIIQYGNETSSSLHEMRLPLDGIGHLSRKDDLAVNYLFYNNIKALMSPGSAQFKHLTRPRSINSNVVSASIFTLLTKADNLPKKIHLERPMNFTLSHTKNITDEVAVCAYWQYNESTLTGDWMTDGCDVVETHPGYTICQCNHLTNFAILMDVTGTKLSHLHELSLKSITYVGCAVSIICLFMCFVSFTLFRNLQSDRNTIHKNLVLCLMIAELMFVCGIGQTENKVSCAAIAGLLHFFFLSSFSWMCLEGVQLYFMLIEVFEAERSRVRWFYAFGYGVPALIVVIAAAVDHKSYGTNTSCWLHTENYFILSFAIPAALVILINIIMLGIAVYMMHRHAGIAVPSLQVQKWATQDKMKYERGHNSIVSDSSNKIPVDLPTWLKGSAVLVVLLGLTWIFGFAYVNQDTVVMAYIFTILNSLQGLFIFIFHCFMDRKVKKEWRRAIFNATWLPQCCRVNIGGFNGHLSSPSPTSSSAPTNYFMRLLVRRRKRSSATSVTTRNRRSDLESFLNTDSSSGATTRTGLNRYSNQSDKLLPNGQNIYSAMPTHYEGGIIGNLSVVDGSVVDSENVTEYCYNNMRVSEDHSRYSSALDDTNKDGNYIVSIDSISKNRPSFLLTGSNLKNNSEFTSDNEDGRINYATLNADVNDGSNQNGKIDCESEHNMLDALTLYQNPPEKPKGRNNSFKQAVSKETSCIERKTGSAPDLKLPVSNVPYANEALDVSSQPLLGSLPNLSTIHEGGEDELKTQCDKSADLVINV